MYCKVCVRKHFLENLEKSLKKDQRNGFSSLADEREVRGGNEVMDWKERDFFLGGGEETQNTWTLLESIFSLTL